MKHTAQDNSGVFSFAPDTSQSTDFKSWNLFLPNITLEALFYVDCSHIRNIGQNQRYFSIKNLKHCAYTQKRLWHKSRRNDASRYEDIRSASNMDRKTQGRHIMNHSQKIAMLLVCYDMLAVSAAYFFALLLRFDFRFSMIPAVYYNAWLRFSPIYAVLCVFVFRFFKLYRSIWRFASYTELKHIIEATAATFFMHSIGITLIFCRMPISYYLIGAVVQFFLITAVRFSYRYILLLRADRDNKGASRVMLIGAGSAVQILQRDIRRTKSMDEQVICFIDDNKNKLGREVDGTPVVGGRKNIKEVAAYGLFSCC